MPPNRTPPPLPAAVSDHLGAEDDRELWEEVLRAVAKDASTLLVKGSRSPLYATIGACSHWVRPHQSRWTAAGGFALPVGYGDAQDSSQVSPTLIGERFCNSTTLSAAGRIPNKRRLSASSLFVSPYRREARAIGRRPSMPSGREEP
jgi:hypothetical protein